MATTEEQDRRILAECSMAVSALSGVRALLGPRIEALATALPESPEDIEDQRVRTIAQVMVTALAVAAAGLDGAVAVVAQEMGDIEAMVKNPLNDASPEDIVAAAEAALRNGEGE